MNCDQLKNLLQDVDESATPPAIAADLVARVRRRARSRESLRRGLGTAMILLVLAPIWILRGKFNRVEQSQGILPHVGSTFVVASPQTFEQLEANARVAQATADAILLARRADQAAAELPADVLAEHIRQQLDETSLMMVNAGDLRLRDGQLTEAASAYQRVQVLFPGTSGAEIAGRRLTQSHS